MKISVLGPGNVGLTLATGMLNIGYEVTLGSRDINKENVQNWLSSNPNGKIADLKTAANLADVIFLCTPWTGTESALELAGKENFKNKIIIDVINPLDFSSGTPKLSIGFTDSAGEQIQKWLPESKVVKAFNIITAVYMTNGVVEGEKLDMFIAGNDLEAKKVVSGFLNKFNWNVHDLGSIEEARLLESFAMLWIKHGVNTGKWSHAFKLVGR